MASWHSFLKCAFLYALFLHGWRCSRFLCAHLQLITSLYVVLGWYWLFANMFVWSHLDRMKVTGGLFLCVIVISNLVWSQEYMVQLRPNGDLMIPVYCELIPETNTCSWICMCHRPAIYLEVLQIELNDVEHNAYERISNDNVFIGNIHIIYKC